MVCFLEGKQLSTASDTISLRLQFSDAGENCSDCLEPKVLLTPRKALRFLFVMEKRQSLQFFWQLFKRKPSSLRLDWQRGGSWRKIAAICDCDSWWFWLSNPRLLDEAVIATTISSSLFLTYEWWHSSLSSSSSPLLSASWVQMSSLSYSPHRQNYRQDFYYFSN